MQCVEIPLKLQLPEQTGEVQVRFTLMVFLFESI